MARDLEAELIAHLDRETPGWRERARGGRTIARDPDLVLALLQEYSDATRRLVTALPTAGIPAGWHDADRSHPITLTEVVTAVVERGVR